MAGREDDARVRRIWERDAHRYDRLMRSFDRRLVLDGRAWVCGRAWGRVLEVAVGTGRNLPHYAAGTDLTGVDLSPAMLRLARERARELSMDVPLIEARAGDLPFPDGSFDTVVCVLALCCIPDDRAAIAEMRRVLRPGGTLLLLDHVASGNILVRAAQHVLEPVAVRLSGDHWLRRPLNLVREAGFTITRRERYRFGVIERLAAVKP